MENNGNEMVSCGESMETEELDSFVSNPILTGVLPKVKSDTRISKEKLENTFLTMDDNMRHNLEATEVTNSCTENDVVPKDCSLELSFKSSKKANAASIVGMQSTCLTVNNIVGAIQSNESEEKLAQICEVESEYSFLNINAKEFSPTHESVKSTEDEEGIRFKENEPEYDNFNNLNTTSKPTSVDKCERTRPIDIIDLDERVQSEGDCKTIKPKEVNNEDNENYWESRDCFLDSEIRNLESLSKDKETVAGSNLANITASSKPKIKLQNCVGLESGAGGELRKNKDEIRTASLNKEELIDTSEETLYSYENNKIPNIKFEDSDPKPEYLYFNRDLEQFTNLDKCEKTSNLNRTVETSEPKEVKNQVIESFWNFDNYFLDSEKENIEPLDFFNLERILQSNTNLIENKSGEKLEIFVNQTDKELKTIDGESETIINTNNKDTMDKSDTNVRLNKNAENYNSEQFVNLHVSKKTQISDDIDTNEHIEINIQGKTFNTSSDSSSESSPEYEDICTSPNFTNYKDNFIKDFSILEHEFQNNLNIEAITNEEISLQLMESNVDAKFKNSNDECKSVNPNLEEPMDTSDKIVCLSRNSSKCDVTEPSDGIERVENVMFSNQCKSSEPKDITIEKRKQRITEISSSASDNISSSKSSCASSSKAEHNSTSPIFNKIKDVRLNEISKPEHEFQNNINTESIETQVKSEVESVIDAEFKNINDKCELLNRNIQKPMDANSVGLWVNRNSEKLKLEERNTEPVNLININKTPEQYLSSNKCEVAQPGDDIASSLVLDSPSESSYTSSSEEDNNECTSQYLEKIIDVRLKEISKPEHTLQNNINIETINREVKPAQSIENVADAEFKNSEEHCEPEEPMDISDDRLWLNRNTERSQLEEQYTEVANLMYINNIHEQYLSSNKCKEAQPSNDMARGENVKLHNQCKTFESKERNIEKTKQMTVEIISLASDRSPQSSYTSSSESSYTSSSESSYSSEDESNERTSPNCDEIKDVRLKEIFKSEHKFQNNINVANAEFKITVEQCVPENPTTEEPMITSDEIIWLNGNTERSQLEEQHTEAANLIHINKTPEQYLSFNKCKEAQPSDNMARTENVNLNNQCKTSEPKENNIEVANQNTVKIGSLDSDSSSETSYTSSSEEKHNERTSPTFYEIKNNRLRETSTPENIFQNNINIKSTGSKEKSVQITNGVAFEELKKIEDECETVNSNIEELMDTSDERILLPKNTIDDNHRSETAKQFLHSKSCKETQPLDDINGNERIRSDVDSDSSKTFKLNNKRKNSKSKEIRNENSYKSKNSYLVTDISSPESSFESLSEDKPNSTTPIFDEIKDGKLKAIFKPEQKIQSNINVDIIRSEEKSPQSIERVAYSDLKKINNECGTVNSNNEELMDTSDERILLPKNAIDDNHRSKTAKLNNKCENSEINCNNIINVVIDKNITDVSKSKDTKLEEVTSHTINTNTITEKGKLTRREVTKSVREMPVRINRGQKRKAIEISQSSFNTKKKSKSFTTATSKFPIPKNLKVQTALSNPIFLKPFEFGWKRELVYRNNPIGTKVGDVYYYTPFGKKLRSMPEVSQHLDNNLSLINFTYAQYPLCMNDNEGQNIRRSSEKSEFSKRNMKNCAPEKTISKPKNTSRETPSTKFIVKSASKHKNEEKFELPSEPRPKRRKVETDKIKTSIPFTPKPKPSYQSKRKNRRTVSLQERNPEVEKILLNIFCYLNIEDLLKAAKVSRVWNYVASHESLWKTVRTKNSHIFCARGMIYSLKKNKTVSLHMQKTILPVDVYKKFWKNFSIMIGTVKTLRQIELCKCPAEVVKKLVLSNPKIEVFKAKYLDCSSLDLSKIKYLTNLKELHLRAICPLDIESDFRCLENLLHLEVFSLTSITNLSKIDFSVIGNLLSLKSLSLGDCTDLPPAFSEIVLKKLLNLTSLRLEEIEGTGQTLEIMDAVKSMCKLQQLELINCVIKLKFDDALAACTHIKQLHLIPNYLVESSLTNHLILSGVMRLHATLKHFRWGIASELLKITDLFNVKNCNSETSNNSIAILNPETINKNHITESHGKENNNIKIITLSDLSTLFLQNMSTTKVKIVKLPWKTRKMENEDQVVKATRKMK